MNRWIVTLSACAVVGAAALVGRHAARSQPPAALAVAQPPSVPRVRARDIAILVDRSRSVEDGKGSACRQLVSAYTHAVKMPGVSDQSRVQAFLTGDGQGDLMPALGDPLRVPLLEGGEFVEKDRILLDTATREVAAACLAAMAGKDVTPVYASLKAVVQQMKHDWGCGAARECSLLVVGDLQDTAEKGLSRVLAGKKGDLPPAVDTGGIEVRACGYGQTNVKMPDDRVKRTLDTWSQLVPGIVIVPSCA